MTAIMRTPLVLPVAASITVGLFLVMRSLIDIGEVRPEPVADPPRVEIRFDVPDEPPTRGLDIEEIPAVEPPPAPERIPTNTVAPAPDGDGFVLAELPAGRGEIEIAQTGPLSVDGSPTPVVRVEPVYPARAASRDLEGQCTIIFDITPQGRTANVRVMSCTNRAFEQASINAIQRWRYNPQVSGGDAVMFRGATTQLVYRLG